MLHFVSTLWYNVGNLKIKKVRKESLMAKRYTAKISLSLTPETQGDLEAVFRTV